MSSLVDLLKKHAPVFIMGFGLAFFLLFMGIVPTSFSIGPFELGRDGLQTQKASQTDIPIAIDSQKAWQDTGIEVEKGNTVIIEVTGGKWTTSSYPLSQESREKISDEIGAREVFMKLCG